MISSSFCLIVSQATSSPVLVGGAAAEEALEREDAARRLHPLVVHGPADRGDVHADLVGDLLHLQRLDVLRALVEERLLVLMIARVTFSSVLRRCSMASISHWADWILLAGYSRVFGSDARFL